ncbi:MAG: signal peptidase [Chloroflexota bacterium]|nr:signal peptidase [Chloroflexota bacterium]
MEVTSGRSVASRVAGFTWELLQTVLLTLLIFFAVRAVVQNFKVEGTSMEPTLHNNEFLIINKATYTRVDGTPLVSVADRDGSGGPVFLFGAPARGDIIVFRYPQQPDKDFIKRIIGVPGDTVDVKSGQVTVNGTHVDEPYIRDHASYDGHWVVPGGNYFVLGDNRPNSSDSHVWGYVPADNLIGKAWFSYWPPGNWGPLQPANTALAN